MNILEKWLAKAGVKNIEELSPEEKVTYEAYRKILSKDELSLEDFKVFCQSQISVIEGKWKDLNLENTKKAELIPYHTVYKVLEQVISAPKVEREHLEAHLNQVISN